MQERLLKVFPFVLIFVLGLLIYSNSFQSPFHFDDVGYIEKSPYIKDLKGMLSVPINRGLACRTVVLGTFALNYYWHGSDVFGYHVLNFLVHILVSVVVWWFTILLFSSPRMRESRISRDKNTIALFVSLLFLAHPLQTQSVTYITQRLASIATLFYVLTLCLYMKARFGCKQKLQARTFYLGACLSALAGMLSKEITFTLPLMIILVESMFIIDKDSLRSQIKKNKKMIILFSVILMAFFLFIPFVFQFNTSILFLDQKISSHSHDPDMMGGVEYFLTQLRVVPLYLKLLIFPAKLSLDYDFPISKTLFEPKTFLGFIFICFSLLLAFFLRKKQKLISLGIFWFFITISVESSIILIRNVIFEHRTYLPSVGFFLLVNVLFFKVLRNKRVFVLVMSGIVLIMAVLTYQRNKVWQSDVALWEDSLANAPNKTRPYVNLGVAYLAEERYDDAFDIYNRLIKVNPAYSDAYGNRGFIYSMRGRDDLAMKDLNKAISLEEDNVKALVNRGNIFVRRKQFKRALVDLNKAQKADPEYIGTYNNRGIAYSRSGEYLKAIADYTKAIELDPQYAVAYSNRGVAYKKIHDFDLALQDFDKALELSPEFVENRNNRGIIFKLKGEYAKALEDFSAAVDLNPEYIAVYGNRGNVYKLMKEFDKAIADYTYAIKLNPRYAKVYYSRALVYLETKQYDKAVKDLEVSSSLGFNRATERLDKVKKILGKK